MTRLLSTILWDIRLQFRNGFYYAALFVGLITIILLNRFNPTPDTLRQILPLFALQNITVDTFYFIAGLVLLEKGEGTLEGLVVTPLRPREYLIAKIVTLTGLAVVENIIIVLVLYGLPDNMLLFTLGLILFSILFTLLGFITVIRFDSINSFLLPSVLVTTFLSLPLLAYFDLWHSWLLYLHPIQGSLLLLKAGFQPVPAWQIGYGLIYSLIWVWLTYTFSQHRFYQFVILKPGVRS